MPEFFRILRGLELDETVRIIQGAGLPGSSSDTDTALRGSLYMDNTTGIAYSKVLNGTGTDKWSSLTESSQQLYEEFAVSPTPSTPQGSNSITLGQGAVTEVTANDSIAMGNQALARHPGAIVHANGRFGSSGDAQVGDYILRTITGTAVPTMLFLDGPSGEQKLILPDNSTWTFTITITAHRTDANDGHAGYEVKGVIYRDSGAATVNFQGITTTTVIAESNPEWDINIFADTDDGSLALMVTGQTGKIIRWLARVQTVELTN